MKYLPVLNKVYLVLLRLPVLQRLGVQSELCDLRDTIAEITNETSEETQNNFESLIAVEKYNKFHNPWP